MARNNNRGRNNNPSGRNQYSDDWMERPENERPMDRRRNCGRRSRRGHLPVVEAQRAERADEQPHDQISEWTDNMRSGQSGDDFAEANSRRTSSSARPKRSGRKSQQEISEETLSSRKPARPRSYPNPDC